MLGICSYQLNNKCITIHSNRPDDALTQMLLEIWSATVPSSLNPAKFTYSNFEDEPLVAILSFEGIENRRKFVSIEFDFSNILASSHNLLTALLVSFEALAARSNRWEGFLPTVNNSSDNLMNLSVLGVVGAGKACT